MNSNYDVLVLKTVSKIRKEKTLIEKTFKDANQFFFTDDIDEATEKLRTFPFRFFITDPNYLSINLQYGLNHNYIQRLIDATQKETTWILDSANQAFTDNFQESQPIPESLDIIIVYRKPNQEEKLLDAISNHPINNDNVQAYTDLQQEH